jgi:hypothetical protein
LAVSGSSTFAASVEADRADEADKEAMAIIGYQAAWFSIDGEREVTVTPQQELLNR